MAFARALASYCGPVAFTERTAHPLRSGTGHQQKGAALNMTTQPSHWSELGNCRGMDPNLFVFQEPRSHAKDAKVVAAKAVCAGCAVVAECLADAMSFDSVGVWGGLSEDERRGKTYRPPGRPRTVNECGTNAGYRRHLREGEPVDDACRAAHNAYVMANRASQAVA